MTEWSTSENNRRAKYYSLSEAGRKQLQEESGRWGRMSRLVGTMLRMAAIAEVGEGGAI